LLEIRLCFRRTGLGRLQVNAGGCAGITFFAETKDHVPTYTSSWTGVKHSRTGKDDCIGSFWECVFVVRVGYFAFLFPTMRFRVSLAFEGFVDRGL